MLITPVIPLGCLVLGAQDLGAHLLYEAMFTQLIWWVILQPIKVICAL